MSSSKAVHKARMTVAWQKMKSDSQLFKVLELTTWYVLFQFAGYKIRFEFHQGDVVRLGGDHVYLAAEDYALLFTWASMLMNANLVGLKASRQVTIDKKTSKKIPVQLHLGL